MRYITSTRLADKVAPSPPPRTFAGGPALRLTGPGRPPEVALLPRAPKSIKPGALVRPGARADLLHRFWHHELQAAELFAWAILAFPETPEAFRRGLLAILLEEVGHMALYAREIERLGFAIGSFGVRDWFWARVQTVTSPLSFVALIGMGFESANLDHAPLFGEYLRAAGDESAARTEERIGLEEERHVAFAAEWFVKLSGGALDFEAWSGALPEPLTPLLFRGKQINRAGRERAGQPAAFVQALSDWQPAERI